MLGRKDYTEQELQHGKNTIKRQLAAFRKLAKPIATGAGAEKAQLALEEFEPLFFNNMVLVLDRFYVHRVRVTAGKDGNPLNEVELIADSLMNNDGVLQGNNVVKYDPEKSVVKLKIGDRIGLVEKDFERLASAFFDELEKRFVN